jgi:hypothetical protein
LAPLVINGNEDNKMGELFSKPHEIHAFTIGFGEAVFPVRPIFNMKVEYDNPLVDEYHYYMAGRAVGFILLLGIIIGAIMILGG